MSVSDTILTFASNEMVTVLAVNPTSYSDLVSQITLATAQFATETNDGNLISLERVIGYANASLQILSAQQFIATATGTATYALPQATDALYSAAEDIMYLDAGMNLFSERVLLGPNALFTVLFGILTVAQLAMGILDKYIYFGICMFAGCGLEFAGYLSRSLASGNETNMDLFLCQIITLTIAPVFIMAAIYYMLGQQIVLHGRRFGLLSPRLFSLVFITCDVISLVVQAIGGGIAGYAASTFNNPDSGTYIMVAGVAFQLASMSLFLVMLFDFVRRSYFHASSDVVFLFANFFAMLFNTKHGKQLRGRCEPFYVEEYAHTRKTRFSNWSLLVILASTLLVYTRNVYRVIELGVGWTGYLMVEETYLLVLDAAIIFCACLLLTLQHPLIGLGRGNKISTLDMKSKNAVEIERKSFEERSLELMKLEDGSERSITGSELPVELDINRFPASSKS